ncbi:hypothetical protein [Natronomonas moolapensis]|uniref:hypothetical protein n=1 Tax=Natronomonas moolapensis TaxID=416273 RepID=UPI001363ED14|nr:hypothetical protein [Natronomonas moolapensis]
MCERSVRDLPVADGDICRGAVSAGTPSPYSSRHRLDAEPTNGTRSVVARPALPVRN